MLPEHLGETMHALGAKRFLTVHHAKSPWRCTPGRSRCRTQSACAMRSGLPILMPRLGDIVHYTDSTFTTDDWWEKLD